MLKFNKSMNYKTYLNNINMISENCNSIKKKILTKSLCNRDIYYFEIGSKQNRTIYVGAFHGMEWITSIILFEFLYELKNCINSGSFIAGINVKRFLKDKGLVIIPCINPDGVEIQINGASSSLKYKKLVDEISNGDTSNWQANARGVDLNHNFNADWQNLRELEIANGITGPSKTRFGGANPESEPESFALAEFCRKNQFIRAIAFHSQGEEIYWDFGNSTPKEARTIGKLLARSSGYKLATPEKLATGGGFKDWFIEEFNKPAFTVEVGLGKNPLPLSQTYEIYNKIKELLVLGFIL